MSSTTADPRAAPSPGLGTFAGVFTPSILTILGIILFLRLGYVVGVAGLGDALVIIGLANLVSVLTSISLAAVATNLRVRQGGDYYLISRTLGVEYGGALGIVLFLAQSVSIAFYAIGFGEVVAQLAGATSPWAGQAIAAGAVAALFVLAWKGADVATKFQFVIMAVLAVALVAFFVGGARHWDSDVLSRSWSGTGELPFWVTFALFFPAVTGFTQGVSMSGDLRDPGKSLPLGTFGAVFLSMIVYFAVAVIFAAALPSGDLAVDYGAMRRVSPAAWLVDAGVIAATLSSALASFLGAPRILQSLARDQVFPGLRPFAVSGPGDNPRRGVLLSGALALGTIALGDLNLIAPVVSMFFLISYGLLNYATYAEARSRSPSFRPRFRMFDARLSLLGCLACIGMMLAIHPTAAAAAMAVLFAIHQYLGRRETLARWSDSGRSHRLQRVRGDLLQIDAQPAHVSDWRPVVLAFSDEVQRRERLLRFASWIDAGAGFTTAVRLFEGEGPAVRREARSAEDALRADIDRQDVEAFPLVLSMPDLEAGLPVLLQAHGLGSVRTNTVLLNWFDGVPSEDDEFGRRSYGRPLRTALRHGCNVVILEASTEELARLDATRKKDRRIDVWSRGDATGRLMLLLAYLMTRDDDWEDARIRFFAEAPPEGARAATSTEGAAEESPLDAVRRMLDEVRIPAEPDVVPFDRATLLERSKGSSLVFLPFRLKDDLPLGPMDGSLEQCLEELEISVLVLAAQDIALDAEPESGPQAEAAAAADVATEAAEKARRAEKDAEKAAREAAKLAEKVEAGTEDPELQRTAQEAGEEADWARRRALKARAKAELSAQEAEALKSGAAREPVAPETPPAVEDAPSGETSTRTDAPAVDERERTV